MYFLFAFIMVKLNFVRYKFSTSNFLINFQHLIFSLIIKQITIKMKFSIIMLNIDVDNLLMIRQLCAWFTNLITKFKITELNLSINLNVMITIIIWVKLGIDKNMCPIQFALIP